MACEIRSDLSSCLSFLGPEVEEEEDGLDFFVPFSFLMGVLLDFLVVAVAALAFLFVFDAAVAAVDDDDLFFFFLGGEGDEA